MMLGDAEANGRVEIGLRLVEILLQEREPSSVEECVCVPGIEGDRSVEIGQGLGPIVLLEGYAPAPRECRGEMRIEPDGLVQVGEGLVIVPEPVIAIRPGNKGAGILW